MSKTSRDDAPAPNQPVPEEVRRIVDALLNEWREYKKGSYPSEYENGYETGLRHVLYRATKPTSEDAGEPREPHLGWLFHNPDTGTEWSPNHPVESGECDDAEEIRPATIGALRNELIAAWEGWAEARQERDRATPTPAPIPADEVREAAQAVLDACIADYEDGTPWDDDESVGYDTAGQPTSLRYRHIRRLLAALAPPEARDERARELRKAAAWLAARDGYDFDSELNDDERGQYLDEAVRFLEATAPAILAILADLDALRRKVAEAEARASRAEEALAAQQREGR